MFKPIKIIDIELTKPIQNLSGLGQYVAVKGLVRLHGVPLAFIQVPVIDGSCSAAQLSAAILEKQSWAILRQLIENGLTVAPGQPLVLEQLTRSAPPVFKGPFPCVTVAVCTRNRTQDLALCLKGLSALNYPALDLLVVDNAPSNDATQRLVREHYPQVRYVLEPRPGLDWARNRAIIEARGEIIAYTDDDVVVDAGWVMALAQRFTENPEVMAVTGLVVPYEIEVPTQLVFEDYGGFGRGFTRQWYTVNRATGATVAECYAWTARFGTGANMAYRRALFAQIGPFDPALDVGTPTNGGGDLEMFFRVLYAGHTLVYEPSALVRHRHRREEVALAKQIVNNGIGFSAYLVRTALAYPDERKAIIRFWISWCGRLLQRFMNCLRGYDPFPARLAATEIKGLWIGLGAYRQAQRVKAKIMHDFGAQTVG